MVGPNEAYYWDACLFLAWLKDEKRPQSEEMDGVREFVERAKRREVRLMTSTLTLTEVTEAKLPVGGLEIFEGLMKRPNVNRVSVDPKIGRLARELRDHFSARPGEFNSKTLSVPDAIHIATAVLYKAKEFHTFDKENRSGTLGLLPLNGNVGGHQLTITKPTAIQSTLDL